MKIAIALPISLIILASAHCSAKVWYVEPDGSGQVIHIQAGIDSCSNGDTLYLAPGAYRGEGNRDLVISGKHINVIGLGSRGSAIIDCEGRDIDNHSAFDITDTGGECILNNFLITNSFPYAVSCDKVEVFFNNVGCTYANWDDIEVGPARVFVFDNSRIALDGCTFADNFSYGIISAWESDVSMKCCEFIHNNRVDSCWFVIDPGLLIGGVASTFEIGQCTFRENFAGVAIFIGCRAEIDRAEIRDNDFYRQFGLNVWNGSHVTCNNVTIEGNLEPLVSNYGYLKISNSSIRYNRTVEYHLIYSGGTDSLVIVDTEIAYNAMLDPCMPFLIYLDYAPSVVIDDCIVTNNGMLLGSSSSNVTINKSHINGNSCLGVITMILFNSTISCSNTTFADNASILMEHPSHINADHCIFAFNDSRESNWILGEGTTALDCCNVYGITGGDWVGPVKWQDTISSNFSADPLFCDFNHGTYTLDQKSPCLPGNHPNGLWCGLIGALDLQCGTASVQTVATPITLQNYPNPFNPHTTISYSISRNSYTTLKVYDVTGGLVRILVDGMREAGAHREIWDGRDDNGREVSSGVYFYQLRVGSFTDTKKLVLVR
jgi:hypothetical protein